MGLFSSSSSTSTRATTDPPRWGMPERRTDSRGGSHCRRLPPLVHPPPPQCGFFFLSSSLNFNHGYHPISFRRSQFLCFNLLKVFCHLSYYFPFFVVWFSHLSCYQWRSSLSSTEIQVIDSFYLKIRSWFSDLHLLFTRGCYCGSQTIVDCTIHGSSQIHCYVSSLLSHSGTFKVQFILYWKLWFYFSTLFNPIWH